MLNIISIPPGSQVDSKVRLNFLKVGKSSSSLRSLPLWRLMQSGPATNKNKLCDVFEAEQIWKHFKYATYLPMDEADHDEEIQPQLKP